MKIEVKIYIKTGSSRPFIGRGPIRLLQEISRRGSIKKAARAMGMSYSKAHGLISSMEENLNSQLLQKTAGGPGGGGSRLTPRALNLIKNYRKLEKEIKEFAHRKFRQSRI